MIDRFLIAALRGYKRWISPLLGQRCRFVPTCSEYSMAAIEHFGAIRGSWLTVKRLSRCHPLHPGGYDPIPAAADSVSSRGFATTADEPGASTVSSPETISVTEDAHDRNHANRPD